MKQHSSNNMDGESRDLLLFDYLEGKLTEARARELEAALAADPLLQAELEEWKASFVVQEFYPTEALEAQLLHKSSKGFSWSGPLAGFIVVLVTSLFSFIPVGEQEEKLQLPAFTTLQQHTPPAEEVFTEPVLKKEAVVVLKVPAAPKAKKEVPAPALEERLLALTVASEIIEPVPTVEIIAVEPATNFTEPDQQLSAEVKEVAQQKKQQPKQISKRQERQLRKMKEKALQQRKANEFIKGDRPYVVPLDTDNF